MNTNTSETIQYAIQLPNGNLADDLVPGRNYGGSYRVIPGSSSAYLWDDPESANNARLDIARHIGYGVGDSFEELSSIVMVHIVATITPIAPDGDDEPAGEREPHTWAKAEDIPRGVLVKPIGWPDGPQLRRNGLGWHSVDVVDGDEINGTNVRTDRELDAVWNPTAKGFIEVLS